MSPLSTGSAARIQGIYDLPEIVAEETDWGMIRYGSRGNEVRISLHYMPNCTRVIVPPMAGLDGAGGWRELYLAFTPIDDENQHVVHHQSRRRHRRRGRALSGETRSNTCSGRQRPARRSTWRRR